MNNKNPMTVLWAGALMLLFPLCQYAYLDPGTGSYLFQVLLAGLLGAGMAVRIFWGKITALFSKKKENPLDK